MVKTCVLYSAEVVAAAGGIYFVEPTDEMWTRIIAGVRCRELVDVRFNRDIVIALPARVMHRTKRIAVEYRPDTDMVLWAAGLVVEPGVAIMNYFDDEIILRRLTNRGFRFKAAAPQKPLLTRG